MLSVRSEPDTPVTAPVPSADDVEQLHESARERIRTILKRTQPILVNPALADLGPPESATDAAAPEVAPIPSAPRELPSPYESDAADEEIDLHESARKRIRKITQPVDLPLPTAAARPADAEGPRAVKADRSLRRPLQIAGFVAGLAVVAAVLNLKLIASALNYDELDASQIRQLAPELGGGYIVKHATGGQFIGYIVRGAGQTSHAGAGALATRLLERLKGHGVQQVVLLDRDNIPVAVMRSAP
jgi:hypothetical protein